MPPALLLIDLACKGLLDGLEVVPRKAILYHGQTINEMDLDALLARRPALALVDELAHTNAPGSRHPKRHLDVAELLAAGIDVYTAVNIQHIESLNDVVAQITNIRVRETVPDSVFDRADDIELIDLTCRLSAAGSDRPVNPWCRSSSCVNQQSLGRDRC